MEGFYAGQKVICIDDAGQDQRVVRECGGRLTFSMTYIIRGVINTYSGGRVVVGVLVEGIYGEVHVCYGLRIEHSWRPDRFAPLGDEPMEVERERKVKREEEKALQDDR
jgi:hypothetical protein